MGDAQTVLNLKQALEKELQAASSSQKDGENKNAASAASTERCRDILEQLDAHRMTLAILTETLIGATVNKLKAHRELGRTAKALVKKWKKVVASEQPAVAQPNIKKEKPVPPQRRESSSSHHSGTGGDDDQSAPELEWQGLPDPRQSICQKLYTILQAAQPALLQQGVSPEAVRHLTGPRAAETERALHEAFSANTKAYTDKARSLCFNLKKNTKLAVSLCLGQVEPTELVHFTAEQLASDDIKQQRRATAQKLIDSRRLDWDQANEDKINRQCGIQGDLLQASLFTCGRCKSVKTTSTQKQTRSADEPMTVFVLCLSCGKRWKC